MIYRKFGKTGLEVSAIGLGCEYVWFADEAQVKEVVQTAVDAGINYFDLFVGTPTTRESQNTNRDLKNPFAGILYCGKCGGIMKRNIPGKQKKPWFRCMTRGCDCKIIKC